MARPPKKDEDRKTSYIRVRVTSQQRAEINRKAKKAGAKNASVWVLNKLLGSE